MHTDVISLTNLPIEHELNEREMQSDRSQDVPETVKVQIRNTERYRVEDVTEENVDKPEENGREKHEKLYSEDGSWRNDGW